MEKPDIAKLSIAFFSHSSELGGAERCLLDLVGDLCADGVTCYVVMTKKSGVLKEKMQNSGAVVFMTSRTAWWTYGMHRWKSLRRFFRSLKIVEDEILPCLKKWNPDIIYSQTVVSPWGIYCAELLNKPHALGVTEFGKLDHGLDFMYGYEESMNILYKNSLAVFWLTNSIKKEFARFLKPPDAIFPKIEETVYGKIDLELCKKNLVNSRTADKIFKVGIFGRNDKNKGQEDLIKACAKIIQNGVNIKCYLVGADLDSYSLEIKNLILESSSRDFIQIVDFQKDPYLLMEKMDTVVSCSRNEAMGRTLLEAVLLGIPVVFPNTGGPSEIFKDGIHGLSYPAGDFLQLAQKLEEIRTNPTDALNRAYQAQVFIKEKFSKENFSGKIKNALLELKKTWKDSNERSFVVSNFLFNNQNLKIDVLIFSTLCKWSSQIRKIFTIRR